MLDIYKADPRNLPTVEEAIKAAMEWHFTEETASPFWLEKLSELPFNPIKDIKTLRDLDLFPDYTEEMKHIAVEKMIPKGMLKYNWDYEVFESGGTTGSPQKIVDMLSRKKALEWVYLELEAQGAFEGCDGHWLHIGPTGPHIVGRSIGRLAKYRSKLCYYIDFDPRWVKKCVKNGQTEIVQGYVQHIVEQALAVLKTQNIKVLFATPAVLDAISKHKQMAQLIREKVKLIIWAGTSIDEGMLDALETIIFPEIKIIGLYGNTLMGIAPQRRRFESDKQLCVFQTFHPFSIVRLVDKQDSSQPAKYGEYGQVKLTLLSPELLIPSHLERDQAMRIAPAGEYAWDGVSDVKPLECLESKIFEGVY